jgi:hypothetical protein
MGDAARRFRNAAAAPTLIPAARAANSPDWHHVEPPPHRVPKQTRKRGALMTCSRATDGVVLVDLHDRMATSFWIGNILLVLLNVPMTSVVGSPTRAPPRHGTVIA